MMTQSEAKKTRLGRVVFKESTEDWPPRKSWEVRFRGSLLAVLTEYSEEGEVALSWGFFAPFSCVAMEWPSMEDAKRFIHRKVMGYMKAMKLGVEPDELSSAIHELENGRFELL